METAFQADAFQDGAFQAVPQLPATAFQDDAFQAVELAFQIVPVGPPAQSPRLGPHEHVVYPRIVHEQGFVEEGRHVLAKVYETGARLRARGSLRVGKVTVSLPARAPVKRSRLANPPPFLAPTVAVEAPVFSTGATLSGEVGFQAAAVVSVSLGAGMAGRAEFKATAEVIPDQDLGDLAVLDDDEDLDLLRFL